MPPKDKPDTQVVAVKIPERIAVRVDALVAEFREKSALRDVTIVSRSTFLRWAIGRGLAILEQEFPDRASPQPEPPEDPVEKTPTVATDDGSAGNESC